jgi:hypothetical protein
LKLKKILSYTSRFNGCDYKEYGFPGFAKQKYLLDIIAKIDSGDTYRFLIGATRQGSLALNKKGTEEKLISVNSEGSEYYLTKLIGEIPESHCIQGDWNPGIAKRKNENPTYSYLVEEDSDGTPFRIFQIQNSSKIIQSWNKTQIEASLNRISQKLGRGKVLEVKMNTKPDYPDEHKHCRAGEPYGAPGGYGVLGEKEPTLTLVTEVGPNMIFGVGEAPYGPNFTPIEIPLSKPREIKVQTAGDGVSYETEYSESKRFCMDKNEIPVSGILFSKPAQVKLNPKDVPREFVNAGGFIDMRFDIRCDPK